MNETVSRERELRTTEQLRAEYQWTTRAAVRMFLRRHGIRVLRRGHELLADRREVEAEMRRLVSESAGAR